MTIGSDVTRRDFLKRGALLGGAVAWATPLVHTIGMGKAQAQSVSPVCGDYFAVKIEMDGQTETLVCEDIHDQIDPGGRGHCLDVDTMATPLPGGCAYVASATKVNPKKWVVTLDSQFAFELGEAFVKSGSKEGFCSPSGLFDASTGRITFDTATQSISNVQFLFCRLIG